MSLAALDALELPDEPEPEDELLDEPEEPEEPDEPDEPDEPEEPDEPDEPELDVVEAEDAAVDELDSPLLSAVVWDAVSHAAMKKAIATRAIRRCNMVMLPVLGPVRL